MIILLVLVGLVSALVSVATASPIMFSTNLGLFGVTLMGAAIYMLLHRMHQHQKETAAASASKHP